MSENSLAVNPHRPKMDGSLDLLCLACLRTIEAERNGAGHDGTHVCDSNFPPERRSTGHHNAA